MRVLICGGGVIGTAIACFLSRRGATVHARQACFRPMTRDGLPLLGPIGGVEGAHAATGHDPARMAPAAPLRPEAW